MGRTHVSRPRRLINKLIVQVQNEWLRRERVFGHPFQLTLESGNVCNLGCPLCPTPVREKRLPSGMLKVDDARRIIDRFPYLTLIVLSNWGEPFLNKRLPEIIRYARSKHIRVHLESNLTLLTNDQAEAVVASGLDTLMVALDGATQASYAAYRVGGVQEDVLENVRRIRRVQERTGDRRTELVWKFVENRHNEHELETARAMALELGMRFERVTIWSPPGQEDEWRPRSAEGAGRRTTTGSPKRCHNLWQVVTVNFNGDLHTCCSEFAPSDRIGNVLEEEFAPLWNGPEYRRRRREN